ncbi:HWE histidine kinase domain-containing protein [Consotaella salsifontis]|uniref:Blue-light-activated histidine kinase n=1 Tax=Consotaella salsifontis TaxID=1365950 RepID=A0A1T4MBJ0_9HYPH|nr:HWE histidine kinase domain-containing protein [Consotaella salsifontis]SJZ64275.1 PAS domain S-box-containing protein [Consotaella salsifontis]
MNRLDFQGLFAALSSPHMIVDHDCSFVAVNEAYETATNHSRELLLGRNLFDVFPNEGEPGRRLRNSIESVFATGKRDVIAYIHYEIPRPGNPGEFDDRYWSAVHSPLFDKDGKVIFVLQNTADVTELVRLREAAALPFRLDLGEMELIQRAQEAEAAYKATLSASADFRRLFQQAPGLIAVMHGPDHFLTFVNDAFGKLVGGRDLIGMPLREALPDLESQGFFEMLSSVYSSGEAWRGEDVPLVLGATSSSLQRNLFVDLSFSPIRDAAGGIVGILMQGGDKTEAVRAKRRHRLMVDELNHRVKNTLATVQSIARQSFRSANAPESVKASFEARIVALSDAHNLLSRRYWEAVDLSVLLAQELSDLPSERVRLVGRAVDLNPKSAIAFAMIFHELATNASQYGAFASSEGELSVEWREEQSADGPKLVLEWIESGASAKPAMPASGFGATLLSRLVEGELSGHLRIEVRPDGVMCYIDVPAVMLEPGADAVVN